MNIKYSKLHQLKTKQCQPVKTNLYSAAPSRCRSCCHCYRLSVVQQVPWPPLAAASVWLLVSSWWAWLYCFLVDVGSGANCCAYVCWYCGGCFSFLSLVLSLLVQFLHHARVASHHLSVLHCVDFYGEEVLISTPAWKCIS